MGGRHRLGPTKATTEATPAYTTGVLPDPFVAGTFVDPADTSGAPGSPVIVLPDMRNTNLSAGDQFRPCIIYLCCLELSPRSSFECNEIHHVCMKIRYFI